MKSSRKYWKFPLVFILFSGVGLLLNACQATPVFPGDSVLATSVSSSTPFILSTKVVLPTLIHKATITPTATEIPPTPTPTDIPCIEMTGSIKEVAFYSDTLQEDIKTNIYLPPCYNPNRDEGYPLLVMLHGQNGVQDQWINLGMTDLADEWITSKKIKPLVIVMPFERLYLLDSYVSKFDSALVEDLLPQLLDQYNLRSEWAYRAIGGLSRGGNWAVRIGFVFPDAFGRVGAHSFTTFAGDMGRVQDWIQSVSAYRPALWFDIGETDHYRQFSEPFVLYLQQNQVPLEYTVNPGGHTIDYWEEHVDEYLAWYTRDW
ncbi:MAG: hypothetical protein CVU40_11915 [Chloroflexi bacterium HGW-Chloroflexi-2]|jgi:enterochelin esterase-like enzyme|nr:MAG: hypothetical protein CVU40_11915 [Chloroflexi bacterium HGW-Chloroflexi-2]